MRAFQTMGPAHQCTRNASQWVSQSSSLKTPRCKLPSALLMFSVLSLIPICPFHNLTIPLLLSSAPISPVFLFPRTKPPAQLPKHQTSFLSPPQPSSSLPAPDNPPSSAMSDICILHCRHLGILALVPFSGSIPHNQYPSMPKDSLSFCP